MQTGTSIENVKLMRATEISSRNTNCLLPEAVPDEKIIFQNKTDVFKGDFYDA